MSVIYIIMLALYGLLFVISRKENIASDSPSVWIDLLFAKAAEYLVRVSKPIFAKLGSFRFGSYFARHDISRKDQLTLLDSSIPVERQLHDIRTDTVKKVLMLLFCGTVLSLMICVSQMCGGVIEEGDIIERNSYDKGGKKVDLLADVESEEESISYTIGEREYTDEELDSSFERLSDILPELVKGENADLDNVRSDLMFARNIEGYPFSISWESSDYSVIDSDGKVKNDDSMADETITVTAVCTSGKKQRITSFGVHVLPRILSDAEKKHDLLEDALKHKDAESKSEEYFRLPDTVGGKEVSWSEGKKDSSIYIMVLVIIGSAVLVFGNDVHTEKRLKERRDQLLSDYPGMVSKVTLYMSAGMSFRNVLFRMAEESCSGNNIRDGTDYLNDEIRLTCNELQSGVQEMKAYEDFSRRCGIRQYMRFGTLVTQNLKKGSSDFLRVLRQEADESLEERKNNAKEIGEQASTKLLFPMMMMLVVVMVIIIAPAFMSFAG